MSSIRRCISGVRIWSTGMGSATWRSTGCPRRATFNMAMSFLLNARIVARAARSPRRVPLEPVVVGPVGLEIAEEGVHIGGGVPDVEVLGLDEAQIDAPLDLGPERLVVAVEAEHRHGLPVVTELLERHHLEDLLEGAHAAGKGHEGVAS